MNAIDYYRDKLICWYEAAYGHQIDFYTETNLEIIASFYGNEKLQHEYWLEIAGCGRLLKWQKQRAR